MQHSQIELNETENSVKARMKASLVIASTFAEVTIFIRRLLKLLWVGDFQGSDLFGIRLAVEEALVNAVKHGNQMDRHKKIHVLIAVGPREFRIRISDEGRGFDPDAIPNPTDPEYLDRPTGRGIWLMRHYMHTVRFNAKGNAVLMVRQRAAAR